MIERFGTLPDGRPVERVTLSAGGLSVKLLSLGAILQDVRLAGVPHSLTLGSDSIAAYAGPMAYYGAVVGPVANRIAGATAEVDGRTLKLVANEKGRTTLHGGAVGLHGHVWNIGTSGPDHVDFTLSLPDGTEGWPGNRQFNARFRVRSPATLELELTATTDAPTLINLANHSYWVLGEDGLEGHRLEIAADRYTPVDAYLIPTGISPVEGTGFDFRHGGPVGREGTRLDHNFCLAEGRRAPAFAARLTGPTGISMTIETTEPGLQVYDASGQNTAPHAGHTGQPYGPFAGVALEAQCWPDAPHHPDFPPITLRPGETYRQVTRWTFKA